MDFDKCIDTEHYYKKLEQEAKEIKGKYASNPYNTKSYLTTLFEYFFDDIKCIAKNIFDYAVYKNETSGKNPIFTPYDLKCCITQTAFNLLPQYDRIITGYNLGGMFRDIKNLHEEKDTFKNECLDLINKQANFYENEYQKFLNEKKRKNWSFYLTIIGFLISLLTLIYSYK